MAPKRATRSTPVTENPTTTTVTNAQLQAMIDQGVTVALVVHDANMNGDDSHTSGTGARRTERVARECTYQDFMKCQPLYFKGTEGVVELTQWFERMETVLRISNCSVENQIKFSTYLRKKMTDKYCPRNEIKKLEAELWNLKVKGTNVTGYNQRFQELALLCVRMFPEESDKVERYVGGLPDMIHGSVVASKPKTMQEATEMATELMDKKISTFAERQAENKRKLDNNHQTQQQLPKRQNVVQAYAAGTGERKEYAGTLPLCNKCKFHHNGPCTVKCANCKRVGHLTRDCWSSAATNNQRTLTCYECGNQGHYKSDCPKLKNRNHGNQAEGTGTHGMVLALGGGETDQDPNNIEDEIEA
ncbi:reverse transcriptase domain-containing protein [Tanacetum coccineum]|uniref:Reverse transcriptase domain-containing protein n=1 Tax=Tanacetum coccineum TaxID=301880 RepID=A0ABQ4ZEA2_9ASTR